MPKIYSVLWIDDEFEELGPLADQAARIAIKLVGFASVEAGFEELEKDLSRYDAILLDAKSFEKKNQVRGTEHERALDQARDKIMALKHKKFFPYFVFTGQKGLQNDSSFTRRYEGQYFKKGSPDETERLFAAIKQEVDAQPETQLRHRYAPAFAACTSQYAGERAGRLLYEMLAALHEPELTHGDDLAFNTLRQILEELFIAACNHGLLPPECLTHGKVNITNSGQLLAGKTVKVSNTQQAKLHSALLPEVLADLIETLVSLTSNGSHAAAPVASSRLISLRQSVRTPYLQAALTYQILDLLVWFKALLDDATKMAQADWHLTSLPVSGAAIAGKIEKITASGGAIFIADADGAKASISPNLVTTRSLTAGQSVQVILHDLISVRSIPA